MTGSIFFTSDTHFGHKRIIEYCNRPFASLEDMTEGLIERWNARVSPGDTVYHLGDFAFYSKRKIVEGILSRLNGHKHLICGNHDHEDTRKAAGWASVKHSLVLRLGQEEYGSLPGFSPKVILSHFPYLSWDGMHKGSLHCHGHSHGSLDERFKGKRLDVGVDGPRRGVPGTYAPWSLEEVFAACAPLPFESVDHHTESSE